MTHPSQNGGFFALFTNPCLAFGRRLSTALGAGPCPHWADYLRDTGRARRRAAPDRAAERA